MFSPDQFREFILPGLMRVRKVAKKRNVPFLMVFGTPKDVNEATRICIERTAAGGGYILSSSNSIHGGIPERNFLAMIEAGRKYGKYGA